MSNAVLTSDYVGIEFGSTRIKAVGINDGFKTALSSDHTWESSYVNGIWTHPLDEVWDGLRDALDAFRSAAPKAVGISGMMHGYLAFDSDWNLLTPFRTWQNTITAQAADELTALFGFNIPQRWSIAHLWQAILNGEEHVKDVAHITTLAGYVHFMLTGVNAVGIGEASGIFPIDSTTLDYNAEMLDKFDALLSGRGLNKKIRALLPAVLPAGRNAGSLTEDGAKLIGGVFPVGTPFVPCEGDAGTGMVATNAVAPRTGNVSAGTSIFAMIVLERALKKVYQEIDMVTTPAGAPVAMVHCNNCTRDMNAWAELFRETAALFGADVSTGELFTKLYFKSLEGDADCGGITVFNYLAGEGITHIDEGRPMVIRNADSRFSLANFMRAQLYSSMATMKLGMDILADENVVIDSLTGHGGLFKTPGVGQRYMAAAVGAPITCTETAGEGGPYGMALLAAYSQYADEPLESFLREKVFADARSVTLAPDAADAEGFNAFLEKYRRGLNVERSAVENL